MFEKIRKRLIIWSLTGNFEEHLYSIDTILNDGFLSRLYRRIYGIDKWLCWVAEQLTIAEDYIYRLEELGIDVEKAVNCPIYKKYVCGV